MAKFLRVVFIGIIVIFADSVFSTLKPIPDYLHICHRSDPEITKCIVNSAYLLKSKLSEGIPELEIPPMDPMFIENLIPISGGNGIKVEMINLTVNGTSNFNVLNLRADINKQKYQFQVRFPHMHVRGNYSIDGKVINMPIKGKGDFDLDIYGVKCNVSILGNIINIDGLNFIRFDDISLKIMVTKGSIELRNLFGGDKHLGEVLNMAINSNFKLFFLELRPIIQRLLEDFVLDTVEKLTKHFTYEQLFPD